MAARPHAFVAMPFGVKPAPAGLDGARADRHGPVVDFNRVYDEYIRPALELAGLQPFRADKEIRAGDIFPDMLQELLVADLVVVDLTIEDPNVWYELGVRHALRARGVVIVCAGRVPSAFDLYTNRKVRYTLKDGVPDPDYLEEEKHALAEMLTATADAWHSRKISPVYALMPNLQEPHWQSLRIGDAREFWERHDAWERRIDLARRTGRIGDLLVLADEAPIAAFRVDAWIIAGKALRRAGNFLFALEHLQHGLDRDPTSADLLREIGICLQRLALAAVPGHSLSRARAHYRAALEIFPRDPEMWALLGRVDKDDWIAAWNRPDYSPERRREEAAYEDALLRAAIDSYATTYRKSPGHYYSGINALTLMHLYRHLTGDTRYDSEIDTMVPAVRFAAQRETDPYQLFWSKTTLGDLEVLVGTPQTVTDAYKEAITRNENDWFALQSSRAQLQLLSDLGFHHDRVRAGIAVFDRALARLKRPEDKWEPRQVILFSGHMVDAPGRPDARFPADKEPIAAQKIAEALGSLEAGPDDLALCQAAAGGDLLFLEACQRRGVRCQLLLPLSEAEFIERSILPSTGGDTWRERYFAVKQQLHSPPRIMPEELGPLPSGVDPLERCNAWLLYSTLSWGIPKTRFICLWDGSDRDPDGIGMLYREMLRRTGAVAWIKLDSLFPLQLHQRYFEAALGLETEQTGRILVQAGLPDVGGKAIAIDEYERYLRRPTALQFALLLTSEKTYVIYHGSQPPDPTDINELRRLGSGAVIPISVRDLERALTEDNATADHLRRLEEPFIGRRDPYDEQRPVELDVLFFGRRHALENIPHALLQGQHVAILGLRKVGKTSLIFRLLHDRLSVSPNVWIDCQGYAPIPLDIFNAILEKLQTELTRLGAAPNPVSEVLNMNGFRKAFLALHDLWARHTAASRIIIIFDELDRYFPDRSLPSNEGTLRAYVEIFRALRALAQERRCLSVLAVAYRADINRQNFLSAALGENPMFMSFQEYFLRFLDAEDACTMIRELGQWPSRSIGWEPDALMDVFRLSGGHPLLARFIASEASGQGRETFVSASRVQAVGGVIRREFRRQRFGRYVEESVWNLLRREEREVLSRIAEASPTSAAAAIDGRHRDALAQLEDFGLVEDVDDVLRIRGSLLRDWVRDNGTSS
jgi:tetratricopeptide (TPR) repeat protein